MRYCKLRSLVIKEKEDVAAGRQRMGNDCAIWHPIVFHSFIFLFILSLAGCLESFTRATNQPPSAHYEAGGEGPKDDLPTPHLFDFSLQLSED